MVNEGVILGSDMVCYLNIGASNHMCGHKHLFLNIQEIEDGHVSFEDSTKVSIKDRRKICFSQKDGKEGTMEDVYYVPDLKSNILSMEQLFGEKLFDFHERSEFALEGQKWTSSRKCGDCEKSNVQTEFKE